MTVVVLFTFIKRSIEDDVQKKVKEMKIFS